MLSQGHLSGGAAAGAALLMASCSKAPADTAAATHDTLELAAALAAEGVATWPPESVPLGWNEAVWAFGVHRLYAASGDAAWRDYYGDWMADELPGFTGESPREFHASDEMAPAILAATWMLETGDGSLTPITDAADHYLDTVPRTDEGAIVHWGPGSIFGDTTQVWIDSQFMFGVYLLRQHARTGDDTYLALFTEQYLLFSDLCRDPISQLYRHAYDDVTDANIPQEETFWARGNSWVLIAAAELLALVGPDDPHAAEVLPLFTAHAEAIAAAQEPADGLWHTVLNQPRGEDPDNYTETSASALIAYALARGVRAGALGGADWLAVIGRAAAGVDARIERGDDELVVEGTSFGTNPGDYDYYVSVDQLDDTNLAVGAAVMMLAEIHGLEDPS